MTYLSLVVTMRTPWRSSLYLDGGTLVGSQPLTLCLPILYEVWEVDVHSLTLRTWRWPKFINDCKSRRSDSQNSRRQV